MQDNNTSAFNYREIIGTNRVSNHSLGRAIDINPMQNPYYALDGNTYPVGATYEQNAKGTILSTGEVVAVFKKYGWDWLGERSKNKDFQHFQKLTI
jgi:peptidoglycan LD-endopeptidase CwlK